MPFGHHNFGWATVNVSRTQLRPADVRSGNVRSNAFRPAVLFRQLHAQRKPRLAWLANRRQPREPSTNCEFFQGCSCD